MTFFSEVRSEVLKTIQVVKMGPYSTKGPFSNVKLKELI